MVDVCFEFGEGCFCGCRKGMDDDICVFGDVWQCFCVYGFELLVYGVVYYCGVYLFVDDEFEFCGFVFVC